MAKQRCRMIGTAAVTALLSSVASRVHADAPRTQAQDPVGIFYADLAPDSTAPPVNINAATQDSELDDAVDGDLRIVDRVDLNGYATGALQVFLNGGWGAVCSNTFDPIDAGVACRQMGFIGGVSLPLAIGGTGFGATPLEELEDIMAPFMLENLNCTGSEARLVDCPVATDVPIINYFDYTYEVTYIGRPSTFCDFFEGKVYAFVACGSATGPEDGDVRLSFGATSDDGSAAYGRLEIFNQGGWGSVCSSVSPGSARRTRTNNAPFPAAAADVACRQMGFDTGAQVVDGLPLGGVSNLRRIPITLPGANCTGDEARLTECSGIGLDSPTEPCGLRNIVSLSCFSNMTANEGKLRLMDGSSGPGYEYGRLEIFRRGFWSTICDVEPNRPDTAGPVACKMLGYSGGTALRFNNGFRFPSENDVLVASLPVGYVSPECKGNETTLLDCSTSRASFSCTVSGTNFSDATVLACSNSTSNCSSNALEDPVEGSVRLQGGFGSPCDPIISGVVEIFHLQEWGGVCIDTTVTEFLHADVICRQLGFPHGTDASIETDPPGNTGLTNNAGTGVLEGLAERAWLPDVRCTGAEAELLECQLGQGFRDDLADCGRSRLRLAVTCRTFAVSEALEDVATPGTQEGDLRLVEQSLVSNWQLGRPEVFFEGAWSQICAEGFSAPEADVACRQLGYGRGTVLPIDTGESPDRLVYPEVAFTSLGCTGTEARLLDCPREPEPAPDSGYSDLVSLQGGCFQDLALGLRIACVSESEEGQEGALRLTDEGADTSATGTGVLEIFHAGAWGTVCDSDADFELFELRGFPTDVPGVPPLTQMSATVACRQLGFQDGLFRNVNRTPESLPLLPAWIGLVQCISLEESLQDCGLEFVTTATCGSKQLLTCSNGTDRPLLDVRLVDGQADPDGAWAYGRVEVFNGFYFTTQSGLGVRAVQVTCRSLGFATGAQMLAGDGSALPGEDVERDTIGEIVCSGDELSLTDCDSYEDENGGFSLQSDQNRGQDTVAVVCYNLSGCEVGTAPPQQGDVRLFQLRPRVSPITQACDEVHFGGVELFNDGQWGRICVNGLDEASSVTAAVVCRQLGFPFGGLMAANGARFLGREPEDLVWATEVRCTGVEDRLIDCDFPEEFGANIPVPQRVTSNSTVGVRRLSRTCDRNDDRALRVVCRRFGIPESNVIN